MVKRIILFLLFLSPASIVAQQKNLPLNKEFFINIERHLLKDSSLKHTSVKPLFESQSISYNQYNLLNSDTAFHPGKNWFSRKLFSESFIVIKDTTSKFRLTIDPLFNFEYGRDLEDTSQNSVYKNTRGVRVAGDIGKDFSFESTFYENQATFVNYINDFVRAYGVAPGQGRVKKFKDNGYDFAMASGYISYTPGRYFNIQAGHGKHFIGEGYRSLLLSDNSFNYPYLRATTTFSNFQYTNIYASFMNIFNGSVVPAFGTERLFQKKAAAFQHLSYNFLNRINLGLFQGMIWEANDNKNRSNLDFNYFNPVILSNLAKYGTDNKNNVLLGALLKAKIMRGIEVYSQWMIDDIADKMLKGSIHNKQGIQAGIKFFDLFKLKNLHVRAEYNKVRPYAYAHKKVEQSYTHYNQSLAHPLGANFTEYVSFINYRFKNFYTEIKLSSATIGADTSGYSLGNNIFESDNFAFYGPESTVNMQNQGGKAGLTHTDFKIGYIINPATNFNIIAGISTRLLNFDNQTSKTQYVYFGIRTSLNNVYYDF